MVLRRFLAYVRQYRPGNVQPETYPLLGFRNGARVLCAAEEVVHPGELDFRCLGGQAAGGGFPAQVLGGVEERGVGLDELPDERVGVVAEHLDLTVGEGQGTARRRGFG